MEPDPNIDLELEIDLLRRVGQGDVASFEQLYERFSKVLYATGLRILNDTQATEDVLQDVFLQIWEKAPLYDASRGKPLTWAITLMRNKAIDRLRSARRRSRLHDEVEKEGRVFEHFDSRDSTDAVDLIEKGKLLREALTRLPADQKKAIELAFYSGMTQTEIAEHLGEPLGTIKARIRRGMLKLRDALEENL